MINAGTARRNAGSAVSSRRYAGFAIDWASPLIESELTDALAASARAMRASVRIVPTNVRSKDVPHRSESLLIGIERWQFVEYAVSKFLTLVTWSLRLDRPCFFVSGHFRHSAQRRRRSFTPWGLL